MMPRGKTRNRICASCAAIFLLSVSGCASAAVQRGAAIGAGSGALLGVGTGALISSSVAGSRTGPGRGDITLAPGTTILAAALVGAVLGGVVGAMVGKSNDHGEDAVVPALAPAAESKPSARLPPRAF